jgi:hypothetical protein
MGMVEVTSTFDLVKAERRRQDSIYGGPATDKGRADGLWLGILVKQLGHVAAACRHPGLQRPPTPGEGRSAVEALRRQLIQVGAVCAAWEGVRSEHPFQRWANETAEEVLADLGHNGQETPLVWVLLAQLAGDIGWLANDVAEGGADLSNVSVVAVRALAWAVRLGVSLG